MQEDDSASTRLSVASRRLARLFVRSTAYPTAYHTIVGAILHRIAMIARAASTRITATDTLSRAVEWWMGSGVWGLGYSFIGSKSFKLEFFDYLSQASQ
jgi:hypothetical protein